MPFDPRLEPTQKPPVLDELAHWELQAKQLDFHAMAGKMAALSALGAFVVFALLGVPGVVLAAMAAMELSLVVVGGYMVMVRRHECDQKLKELRQQQGQHPKN